AVREMPAWNTLMGTRRALRISAHQVDPCFIQLAAGSKEVILLPLTLGSAPAGLLVAECERVPRYAEEQLELAEALALQLSLLLELVELAERDRHARTVEERNRMARDIHDTLAQGFTGIVVQLNVAEEMLSTDPARVRAHLATARDLARSSLQEARRS